MDNQNFHYLVVLNDGENPHLVICKNRKELTNLLLALDDNYELVSVEPLGVSVSFDYKDYIKKEKDLETGK